MSLVYPSENFKLGFTVTVPETKETSELLYIFRLIISSSSKPIHCPEVSLSLKVSPNASNRPPASSTATQVGTTDQISVLELATGQPRDVVQSVFDKHKHNLDLALEELMTM